MAPFYRALMVAQSVVQFTISTEKTQPVDFNRFWKTWMSLIWQNLIAIF